ncbi:MAG: C25 family cysteine peptidase, partial [Candidatus Thermoplasmatota archaeon]|nr:C25 family cysteine peptidase [Candidatus Thermoplasmatota archaeon]
YPNDRADKIRQWLKNNYVSFGIDYVLLIGDPDPDSFKDVGDSVGDTPMKLCYPRYFGVDIDGAPTDLYYSDLSSNWDLDGDGFYHELLDYDNPTSPDPSINEDTFSVFWTGEIMCDYNVDYTFSILSDDGIQLVIDGTTVIDNWVEHDFTYDEWTHTMTIGKHDISIFFRENFVDGVVKLYWKTEVSEEDPCYIKNTIVPSDHLYDADDIVGGLTGFYYDDTYFTEWKLTRVDPQIDFIWGTGDIDDDNPDYDAEVFVGRIPVYDNDIEQLDEILYKIIDYETDSGDITWRESILLPMARMNDETSSAGLGEAIMTNIAIPNGFDYYRIYEQDFGFSPELWPCTVDNVKNEWKNGYGMVTWHTHGGEEGASYVMDVASVSVLDDTKPAFTFQGSCHNARPENKNNLAYSLLKHGAIATIAGTRMTTFQYGDYTSFDPAEHMNHQMAYYYTKYIIESGMSAGEAYAEVVKYHSEPSSNAIEFNLYGDPECYLLSTDPNPYPVADANGPYTDDEGSEITFDASGSYDPLGETIEYRWDIEGDGTWDTDWSASPTTTHTWGDDYSGTINVQVRDEFGKTDIASTTVTVDNVAPTTTFDTLGQPNPQFILPYQELT